MIEEYKGRRIADPQEGRVTSYTLEFCATAGDRFPACIIQRQTFTDPRTLREVAQEYRMHISEVCGVQKHRRSI